MRYADLEHIKLHYREDGDPKGPALVFSNSLGTDYGFGILFCLIFRKISGLSDMTSAATDCPNAPLAPIAWAR